MKLKDITKNTANMNKYHNTRTELNGRKYDSKAEATRAWELQQLEKIGEIEDLEYQVPFVLLDPKKGVHRGIKYLADFVYSENGKTVVEDSKGFRTEVFKLKKKMFQSRYPLLELREV